MITVLFLQQDPFSTAGGVSDADLERYKRQKVPTLRDLLDIVKNASVVVMFDVREPVDSNPFKPNTTQRVTEVLNESGIDLEKVCKGGFKMARFWLPENPLQGKRTRNEYANKMMIGMKNCLLFWNAVQFNSIKKDFNHSTRGNFVVVLAGSLE